MRRLDSRKLLVLGIVAILSTLALHGPSTRGVAATETMAFNPQLQFPEVSGASAPYAVVDEGDGRARVRFREVLATEPELDSAGAFRFAEPTEVTRSLLAPAYRTTENAASASIEELQAQTRPNLNLAASILRQGVFLSAAAQFISTRALLAAPASALVQAAPAVAAVQAQAAPQPQYTGEIVSFEFRDFDVRDFFRLISDISGLNVILDPNVAGVVPAMRLTNVPWDQALDVVLKNQQLGTELLGNVLRVATNTTLVAEAAAKKAVEDARTVLTPTVHHDYVLNYSKADAVKTMLLGVISKRGNITADLRRNALYIEDVPEQFARLDQMVKSLDSPSQQVEIEAQLISANKSFSRDIGNQIGLLLGNRNVIAGAGGPVSPNGVPLLTDFPAAAHAGLAFLLQPGGSVMLDEIITIAEASGTAKLLSRPKVTVQNNMVANISQGTQIPVQTNVNNTISTQFLTFALKLSVTPQITAAGSILMTVSIENSQPDFARSVSGIPSIATQQADTKVEIPDGGTAVIGGILVDSDSLNVRQVPGLGSIPIIGNLFKNTTTIKSTTELLFFITPRIKAPNVIEVTGPTGR